MTESPLLPPCHTDTYGSEFTSKFNFNMCYYSAPKQRKKKVKRGRKNQGKINSKRVMEKVFSYLWHSLTETETFSLSHATKFPDLFSSSLAHKNCVQELYPCVRDVWNSYLHCVCVWHIAAPLYLLACPTQCQVSSPHESFSSTQRTSMSLSTT